MAAFKIGTDYVYIGDPHPTYFIAEIGSNHEGSLERAIHLCKLAKEAGADCAKFQHYRADTLASHYGFERISNLAHYKENPYNVFKKYEVPWEWTPILKRYCDAIDIEFMSTPYDLEAVDHLEPYVNAYKIGSGDITYHNLILAAAHTGKPVLLSTGASSFAEVDEAVGCCSDNVCLMQCNTNYTGMYSNYTNLKVLRTYDLLIPNIVLGLSDHSTEDTMVLGAVALGAKVIEKHFTDDRRRDGPDHPFAIEPGPWAEMVRKVRLLERAMGDGIKKVEENEKETVVLQRRCIRTNSFRHSGSTLRVDDLVCLRPAPEGSIPPCRIDEVIGRTINHDIDAGEFVSETDLL